MFSFSVKPAVLDKVNSKIDLFLMTDSTFHNDN